MKHGHLARVCTIWNMYLKSFKLCVRSATHRSDMDRISQYNWCIKQFILSVLQNYTYTLKSSAQTLWCGPLQESTPMYEMKIA